MAARLATVAAEGEQVAWAVAGSGGPYRWQITGPTGRYVDIAGQTGRTYTRTVAAADHGRRVRCIVGPAATITDPVNLTVDPPPPASSPPVVTFAELRARVAAGPAAEAANATKAPGHIAKLQGAWFNDLTTTIVLDSTEGLWAGGLRLLDIAEAGANGTVTNPAKLTGPLGTLLDAYDAAPKSVEGGTWYVREIALSTLVGHIVCIAWEHIPAADRARAGRMCWEHTRRVNQQASNASDIGYAAMLAALVAEDPANAAAARNQIAATLTNVNGQGFHADGSYLSHGRLAMTLLYGREHLNSATRAMQVLAGSQWAFTDAHLAFLAGKIKTTYGQVILPTGSLVGHNGRFIAAKDPTPAAAANAVRSYLTRVSDLLPPGTTLDQPATDVIYRADEGRLIVRRPGHVLEASVFGGGTTGIKAWELLNGVNVGYPHALSHFALWAHVGDDDQYGPSWYVTMDRTRIPGSTVPLAAPTKITGRAQPSPFNLGAVTWTPEPIPTLTMTLDLEPSKWYPTPITWAKTLTVGDDYVRLATTAVACAQASCTVVANRSTPKTAPVRLQRTGQAPQNVPSPTDADFAAVEWLHLGGTENLLYVFPAPVELHVRRETRSSSPSTVSSARTGEPTMTAPWTTAWVAHPPGRGADLTFEIWPGSSP